MGGETPTVHWAVWLRDRGIAASKDGLGPLQDVRGEGNGRRDM